MAAASLVNQFGLGMLLDWRNRNIRALELAKKRLRELKQQSGRTADQVQKDQERMEAAMEGLRRQMRLGFRTMAFGAATLFPWFFAGREAADLEQGLADINTLLVATGYNAERSAIAQRQLKASILATSTAVKVPMRDLVKAGYDLISADLSVAEAQGVLGSTAKLAVAGMGSMQEAVETMTSIMNSFGKRWDASISPIEKGTRIANTLVGTVARLKTTLPELSEAMGYASGTAAQLGLSLGETATAIGMVQTAGIKGMRAGTSLQAMLRAFLQLLSGQRSWDPMLQGLVLIDKQTGKMKPIVDILAELEAKLGVGAGGLDKTANSAMKAAALVNTFGEEGFRAISMLMGQSETLRKYSGEVENSDKLIEMVTARQDAFNSQLTLGKNMAAALASMFGDALLPALKVVVQALKNVTSWMIAFSNQYPNLTKFIAIGATTLGLMITLGGAVMVAKAALGLFGLQAMASSLAATYAAGGFAALAVSVWATLWPILAVTAAVAGLIYLLSKIPGVDINLKSFLPGGLEMIAPVGAVVDPAAYEPGPAQAGTPVQYDYSTHRTREEIHLHGVQNVTEMERELTERREAQTRGKSGGAF